MSSSFSRSAANLAAAVAVLLALSVQAARAECPQYRETAAAPEEARGLANPLQPTRHNLREGKRIYRGRDHGTDCVRCHGRKGDGRGPLARSFAPPPRDFTCAPTMAKIPDGQLFHVIRNGAPRSAMPAHPDLTDEQVWQLVGYLRSLSVDGAWPGQPTTK